MAGGADVSIFDTALHIPAEQRPFAPAGTLTRVTLPMTARPGLRFATAALGAALMAVACLALAVTVAGADGDLSKYGLAALFVVAASIPIAVAVTAVRDAMRGRPMLTIGPADLCDRRLSDSPIGWESVGAAVIVGSGLDIVAVRLTLNEDGPPRYNPFRLGGWSATWTGRRRDRLVALSLLDRRPHDLAHTIVALAERHGATVDRIERAPWS